MVIAALVAAFNLRCGPIVTPYRQSQPAAIREVRGPKTAITFEMVDLSIDLTASYDNPFDPADVALDADITPPAGDKYSIPGFFSADVDRTTVDGKEVLRTKGAPSWHVRMCPNSPGRYEIVVRLRDRSGTVTSSKVAIDVTASTDDGFVRISDKDKRYFKLDSGKGFWPIGANVCWAGPKGMADYETWLPEYGKAGCNYGRLWLSPFWTTFALEVPGKAEEGKGMGQFDLTHAWRIDYALDLAKKSGLRLMLCIDSYNILRDKDAYPQWAGTPHNEANGGPLRNWTHFWTNEAMDKLYRDKLRYLVARYSAYTSVMSWEFWNEVDLTTDFNLDTVGQWHRRMGKALREMDPYHHLVTTSMSDAMGSRELQLLPELDYVQTHAYSETPAEAVITQQLRKQQWGRAHYVGEIGADAGGPRGQDDPTGIQIHDAIWAAIATGSSGSAMPWWWDNYIHPNRLYPVFAIASKFVKDIDWASEEFQSVDPTVAFVTPPTPIKYGDLIFDSGIVGWKAGPEFQPRTITISEGVVGGDRVVASILHGTQNHPELHNPIDFEIRTSRPTKFEVEVGDVSGYGGANLRITFDGERVLTRDFPNVNPAGKNDTMTQYAGKYAIDVPVGRHSIRVENAGPDWLMASYRFKNLVPVTRPPLTAWAVLGNNMALIWARVQGRTWKRVAVRKEKIEPCPASTIALDGLASGTWTAEIWDTWSGVVTATRTFFVQTDGRARFELPTVEKDVAIKLIRSKNP